MAVDRLMQMWQPIVGGFAWTEDRLGLGKLIGVDSTIGRVTFSHSAVRSETHEIPLATIRRAYLPLQTRVYLSQDGRHLLGRVVDRYVEGGKPASYLVRFPGYRPVELPEARLTARCLAPLGDPTEVLAGGAIEAQFVADQRKSVLDQLASVRADSKALAGLLSASVELLPHQVEVVRRVTEDPIQRYILADEVGLGKTIEAAAILRQALLDSPGERVLVLVPRSLVRQWTDELRRRFHLGEEHGVTVAPHEELRSGSQLDTDFLVVDEVHNLIPRQEEMEARGEHYRALDRLASGAKRLLLLSATPVLGDNWSTLALLHLLDGRRYDLREIDEFGRVLAERQEFGRVLLSLTPDAGRSMIRRALSRLESVAVDDQTSAGLATQIRDGLDDGREEDVLAGVRALRDHVIETYRLSHRLLRTRRRDTEGWELNERDTPIMVEVDLDTRVPDAWDALEEWRYRAYESVESHSASDAASDPVEERERLLADRFARLFDALGQGVAEFAAVLQDQHKPDDLLAFPDEGAIVERVRALSDVANDDMERTDLAAGVIDLALRGTSPAREDAAPKVVAFATDTRTANEIADALTRAHGPGRAHLVLEGLDEAAVEAAVGAFKLSTVPAVLVCDRSGEEGLNLQACDAIVHVDLPLNPLRIEQRIGRVDRIGRRASPIRNRVILPTDEDGSPWESWLKLLTDGMGLFAQTIADVQFVLPEILAELRLALFRRGAQGLTEAVPRVRELVAVERARLDEQYALDQLELGASEGHVLYERLVEAEKSDKALATSMSTWWHKVLWLDRLPVDHQEGRLFKVEWSDTTQVPREPWKSLVEPVLGLPLTFDRRIALRAPPARLVRSGNPLIEVLPRFLRYDDRGTAFATWRRDATLPESAGDPWIGFRLVYVVELDPEAIANRLWEVPDAVQVAALQRRADILFPPWTETHHVDQFRVPVQDEVLLSILERPYSNKDKEDHQDFNLASRLGALYEVVEPDALASLCEDLAAEAGHLVESSDEYRLRLEQAQERARGEMQVRRQRLERRRHAQRRDRNVDSTMADEIAMIQELVAGLDAPVTRLDSVGLLVLSRSAPPAASA